MPSYSRKVQVPGKTAQELYDKIAAEIERFMEKIGVGKVEIERDPAKKEIRVTSSMVTATLACQEAAIQFEGKLSLFAAPFKGKIDSGIDRWIAKTFNVTV